MIIKQSIATLFLFFGVSFSAFAIVISSGPHSSRTFATNIEYLSFVNGLGCSTDFGTYSEPIGAIPGNMQFEVWYFEYVDAECTERKGDVSDDSVKLIVTFTCPEGETYNSITGACQAGQELTRCEVLMEQGDVVEVWWDEAAFGRDMVGNYWCASGSSCTTQLQTFVGCDSGRCFADAYHTGVECEHGSLDGFCSDSTCSTELPPGGTEPDPEDPTHNPDDPTGTITDPDKEPDSDTTPVTPDTPAEKPEVEQPEVKPETDTAVMEAITGMNADINTALNNLNQDVNKSSADIQNQLITLNSSVTRNSQVIQEQQTNDNRIYENTKALIQNANADITTAVNRNTNAVNGVSSQVGTLANEVGNIGNEVTAITDELYSIGDSINGLENLDLTGAKGGTCPFNQDSSTCNGYYEQLYPEGFEGIAEAQFAQLETEVKSVVDGMFTLDVSNASAPNFCMDVMQFGSFCFDDYVDLSWIFTFIRACMMFSAVMLCRQLVFGG